MVLTCKHADLFENEPRACYEVEGAVHRCLINTMFGVSGIHDKTAERSLDLVGVLKHRSANQSSVS